jgi:hypothetical protein
MMLCEDLMGKNVYLLQGLCVSGHAYYSSFMHAFLLSGHVLQGCEKKIQLFKKSFFSKKWLFLQKPAKSMDLARFARTDTFQLSI